MDFERLGEAIINDSVEDNDNYVKAYSEEIQPISRFDFEKAKEFLSTTDQRLNISVYDHLADVIKAILRSKISDAADKLEEISLQLKKMRQKPESYLMEVFEISEELQTFVKEKQEFYKFKTSIPKAEEAKETNDDDDEEEDDESDEGAVEADSLELVVEEHDLSEVLPDVNCMMSRFNEAGIGLSPIEVFELLVALKDLAIQFRLQKVKFWGKILGIKNDYYIAEAPYQEGITQEHFGWEDARKSTKMAEDTIEETEQDEDEEEDDDKVEEEPEEEGEEEEQEAVKVPPIPEPKQKKKKRIPAEKNGTGVNEYLYFVCTSLGQQWRVLPFMLPLHVSEARYLKRFFTGDLESQIRGCVPYPGKEAHYLRAQIARITSTAYIAPVGFYKGGGDEDEEDEDDEEKDANEIVINSKYEAKSIKALFSEGIDGWCHYRKALLYQGRCIPMKMGEKDEDEEEEDAGHEDEDEDEDKEEEEPEILEAIVETQVPVLRSLSQDKALGRLKPWTIRLSSKLIAEKAILVIYSNIWPGAYTYYDGKNFEHIYIGYGFKYSVYHYSPAIRVGWQTEYEVGDDVTEHVDKECLPKEEVESAEGENKEHEEEEEEEDEED